MVNLFSITYALKQDWSIGNEGTTIIMKKDGFMLKFDKQIKTKRGYVCGVQIHPRIDENYATPALEPGKTVPMMVYHDTMGHVSEAVSKKTAKYYGIKLQGDFGVCGDCARAKA